MQGRLGICHVNSFSDAAQGPLQLSQGLHKPHFKVRQSSSVLACVSPAAYRVSGVPSLCWNSVMFGPQMPFCSSSK